MATNKVAERPAETGGVAGSFALVIAYLLGVDDAGLIVAIGACIGVLPAVITFIVDAVRDARAGGDRPV